MFKDDVTAGETGPNSVLLIWHMFKLVFSFKCDTL